MRSTFGIVTRSQAVPGPLPGSTLASTRLWLSSELSEEERAALEAAFSDIRQMEAGEELLKEGSRSGSLHLLLDGWACRSKQLSNGTRQIPALLTPGDFCDLDGLMLRRPNYDVITLTPCTVAVLGRDSARDIKARYPRIATVLWWLASVENSILTEWMLCLGRRSAIEHLAHLLCELLVRLSLVGRAEENGYALPMTVEQLADVLGLTPAQVNGSLNTLRNHGLITLEDGWLTMRDWTAMKALSGFRTAYLHPEGVPRLLQAA